MPKDLSAAMRRAPFSGGYCRSCPDRATSFRQRLFEVGTADTRSIRGSAGMKGRKDLGTRYQRCSRIPGRVARTGKTVLGKRQQGIYLVRAFAPAGFARGEEAARLS